MYLHNVSVSKVSLDNMHHNILVDIRCRGEVRRITTNVDVIRILVNTDPIHAHCGRELQVVVVDGTEVLGDAQVHQQILEVYDVKDSRWDLR